MDADRIDYSSKLSCESYKKETDGIAACHSRTWVYACFTMSPGHKKELIAYMPSCSERDSIDSTTSHTDDPAFPPSDG